MSYQTGGGMVRNKFLLFILFFYCNVTLTFQNEDRELRVMTSSPNTPSQNAKKFFMHKLTGPTLTGLGFLGLLLVQKPTQLAWQRTFGCMVFAGIIATIWRNSKLDKEQPLPQPYDFCSDE